MRKKEKYLFFYIGIILLSALFNAFMATLMKVAANRELSVTVVVFWRSFWILLFSLPLFYLSPPKKPFLEKIKTKRVGLHLFRDLMGFIGLVLFFFCVSMTNLAVAVLLFFTIPLFLPFIAYIWKREKFPPLNWLGIGVGLLGIILIIKPGHSLFQLGALIGLLAGLSGAIAQYAVYLLRETETSNRINFYYALMTALIGLLLTFLNPKLNWMELNLVDFLILFGIGVFGFVYMTFLAYALKHIWPVLVFSLLYFTVFFALGLEWFIWGKVVDVGDFIGIVLVILGVMLKTYLHQKKARSQ